MEVLRETGGMSLDAQKKDAYPPPAVAETGLPDARRLRLQVLVHICI
jgi:hypothetical protein